MTEDERRAAVAEITQDICNRYSLQQKDFADLAGVTKQHVNHWYHGKRIPRIKFLRAVKDWGDEPVRVWAIRLLGG